MSNTRKRSTDRSNLLISTSLNSLLVLFQSDQEGSGMFVWENGHSEGLFADIVNKKNTTNYLHISFTSTSRFSQFYWRGDLVAAQHTSQPDSTCWHCYWSRKWYSAKFIWPRDWWSSWKFGGWCCQFKFGKCRDLGGLAEAQLMIWT